jgi:hypothetical protein
MKSFKIQTTCSFDSIMKITASANGEPEESLSV